MLKHACLKQSCRKYLETRNSLLYTYTGLLGRLLYEVLADVNVMGKSVTTWAG
jgi:hypothetical protein